MRNTAPAVCLAALSLAMRYEDNRTHAPVKEVVDSGEPRRATAGLRYFSRFPEILSISYHSINLNHF